MFIWRAMRNILPTKKVLSMKLEFGNTVCSLCGGKEESTWHIFKECVFSRAIIFGSR